LVRQAVRDFAGHFRRRFGGWEAGDAHGCHHAARARSFHSDLRLGDAQAVRDGHAKRLLLVQPKLFHALLLDGDFKPHSVAFHDGAETAAKLGDHRSRQPRRRRLSRPASPRRHVQQLVGFVKLGVLAAAEREGRSG
jgi:hypothetical protein